MVNVNKLKGKIVERGLNVERVAKSLKMNKSTLYRRLEDGSQFTVGEVQALCKSGTYSQEAMEILMVVSHDVRKDNCWKRGEWESHRCSETWTERGKFPWYCCEVDKRWELLLIRSLILDGRDEYLGQRR